MTIDYSGTIQRILDILQADNSFKNKISEFRFGELPEQTMANDFPACYVTISNNPEVSREDIGSANSPSVLPAQKIVTEYWIVLVSSPQPTAGEAQKEIYDLHGDVIRIISSNLQLRDTDDSNPLCATTLIHSQPRLTTNRGKAIDSMTVMVRTVNFENSPTV